MRIFVTGATGFVGGHLVAALLHQGFSVTVCARNTKKARERFPRCDVVGGNFAEDHDPADWLPRLKNCDIVVNAVGIISEARGQTFEDLHYKAPAALFRAASQAGVRQVIQISALGADEGAETAYHLSKKAADDVLCGLEVDSLVLRPSILYGDGARSWQLFGALAALPASIVVDGGRQLVQPVHVDDLVQAIVTAVKSKTPVTGVVDVVGRTAVSFKNLLENLHGQMGSGQTGTGKFYTVSLNGTLALILARLARVMGLKMVTPDTIKMLQRGNIADTEPFSKKFGFMPRDLEFLPITRAERLVRRTYFLPVILRLSIAAAWIWTALVSAFLYPAEDSLALLARTSLTGGLAYAALYGAALLDLVLGLAVLVRFRPGFTTLCQLLLITGYSIILTITIPELWLHPFGPLIKNLPMMAAILALYALETPQ